MATEKQRRRREKEKRHDYDLVEIDAEGNETVIKGAELREAAGPPARVRGSNKKPAQQQQSRGGRRGEPKPASWQRVAKRAAIFGPLFFVVLVLIGGKKMTIAGALLQAVILMLFFVPFSYFMDRFVWNQYQKRQAKQRGGR
jgi:hypothetical protein